MGFIIPCKRAHNDLMLFNNIYIFFFCNLLNSFHGISILSWTLPNIICNLVALWSALLHMKLNCCKISRKNLRNLHGLEVRCWNRILGPIADHIFGNWHGRGIFSLFFCYFKFKLQHINASLLADFWSPSTCIIVGYSNFGIQIQCRWLWKIQKDFAWRWHLAEVQICLLCR